MSKAIEKVQNLTIAALAGDMSLIQEAMGVNIGSGGITANDLTKITVPPQGLTSWLIPSLEGETNEPAITGVIVFAQDNRAYWEKSLNDGGENGPPDCSSPDAITGVGKPGGACFSCPFAQFGSDPKDGRGQACSASKRLFILREKGLLPDMVAIPATSLKACRKYLVSLTGSGIPFYKALTQITLEKAKTPSGIAYSTAVFSFVRKLSDEECAASTIFNGLMKELATPAGAKA